MALGTLAEKLFASGSPKVTGNSSAVSSAAFPVRTRWFLGEGVKAGRRGAGEAEGCAELHLPTVSAAQYYNSYILFPGQFMRPVQTTSASHLRWTLWTWRLKKKACPTFRVSFFFWLWRIRLLGNHSPPRAAVAPSGCRLWAWRAEHAHTGWILSLTEPEALGTSNPAGPFAAFSGSTYGPCLDL